MQVSQYLFQSPSTSPVQVGKLDPSSKEESASNKTSEQVAAPKQELATNPLPIQEVTPKVNTDRLLDTYA